MADFIFLPYFLAVMLAAIGAVLTAKSFLAPPLTPSRFIIACSFIEGNFFANSVAPDALARTPPAPTSGLKFP